MIDPASLACSMSGNNVQLNTIVGGQVRSTCPLRCCWLLHSFSPVRSALLFADDRVTVRVLLLLSHTPGRVSCRSCCPRYQFHCVSSSDRLESNFCELICILPCSLFIFQVLRFFVNGSTRTDVHTVYFGTPA
jgi:hypothetical protein